VSRAGGILHAGLFAIVSETHVEQQLRGLKRGEGEDGGERK